MCACWHYVPQLLLVFGRPPAGYPKPPYASFSSATCARRWVRGDTIVRKYSSVCKQMHVCVYESGTSWSTAEGVDRRQHRIHVLSSRLQSSSSSICISIHLCVRDPFSCRYLNKRYSISKYISRRAVETQTLIYGLCGSVCMCVTPSGDQLGRLLVEWS